MIGVVLRRLAPVAAAVFAVACGESPAFDNLVTEARALAIRIEVVDTGPYSVDLIPVPADRVRASGLPGDTVRAEALIVDPTGIRDPVEFDPRWFLCSRIDLCSRPGALESAGACGDVLPVATACELPRDPSPSWTVPELPPHFDNPYDVLFPAVMLVAGVPGQRSTDDCVAELAAHERESFDDCVLAYADARLGPLGPLLRAAIDSGAVPDDGIEMLMPALDELQPNFHPAITRLRLDELGSNLAILAQYFAEPGAPLTVPAEAEFSIFLERDPRDAQLPSTMSRSEYLYGSVFALDPAVATRSGVLRPPAGRSTLIGILIDDRGGVDWATFPIQVED